MSFRLRHTKRHLCLTLCTALLTVFAVIPSFPVDVPAQTGNLFGPESFARTTGPTNVYTRAFTVPSDVAAPYSLHIQNGQPDGRNRISSGTVSINGVEIIHKSDFSQTVSTIDRSVTLGSTNTLTVTLNSKPNSFIIVTILGIVVEPPPNQPPAARAGSDQTVSIGTTVQLDGRDSYDPEGGLITYAWSFIEKPPGSLAELSDPASVQPHFTADHEGIYRLGLIVNDGLADSPPDEVIITAYHPNTPPTANAGPDQNVLTGTTVQLNGTGSIDPEGDVLTYHWTITQSPAGSTAQLTDTVSPAPSFVADLDGEYHVQLVVNDGQADSAPDEAIIIATTPNRAPTADAGPDQTVSKGTPVHLNGNASFDPDGDPLTYQWSLVSKPAGSSSALDDPTLATPSFPADKGGEYVFHLTVSDGELTGAADAVVVVSVNHLPIANAGSDQTVRVGTRVVLEGGGSSDPDGDVLTFNWNIIARPVNSGATLTAPTSANPNLTPDIEGVYTLQLIVNDGEADSAPDEVQITAENPSFTLSVTKTGTGAGYVSSLPVGVTCEPDCTEVYEKGTTVILTAHPNTGSAFFGFSGGCVSVTLTCSFTLTEDTTVMVSFSSLSNLTLSSITVTPVNPTITVGQAQSFTATGIFSDGSTRILTDGEVTWSSGNTTVATMDTTGPATGLRTGTSTITATAGHISGISTTTFPSPISAGIAYACTVLSDSTLNCWGYNTYGQLGNGATRSSTAPVTVTGITTATAISAGWTHTCAVLSDSTVKCWGYNGYGQLGDGTTTNSSIPVAVSGIATAIGVTTGESHTCALLADGTVKCWGYNGYGQLGSGTTYTSTPVLVEGVSNAVAIEAGNNHTCAVLSNNTVTCWGLNNYGQLGNGTTTNSFTPVSVTGITTATAISAGWTHTCAALSDSTLKCWGNNSSGQLGDGTTTNSSAPVTVTGITTATAVSVGWTHTCAALSDSTLNCWGYNGYGQLGNGTTTNSSTPVTVTGITTATAVSAGWAHTCAALSDSTLRCWGRNAEGQLGNGTTTNSSTPVTVTGITTAATDGTAASRISGSTTLTVNNPVPVLTTLSQSSAVAGTGSFTLTVNGTGFVAGSLVYFSEIALATTFINSTQLTAEVPAEAIGTVGTVPVAVINPSPGGGPSNALNFEVQNPAAVVLSISPTEAETGSLDLTLTVGGTNFVPGAIVYFNNTVLITTYLGATGLIASVPASVLIQSGPYPITVVNPPPGGGSSQSIQFFVQSTHIQLSMTSPISGSFINGSTALVLGTVSSDNGEVGVVVNGVIAQVNGNQFVANHVPLVPGANLITATATDVEGNTRSASIAVTSDGAENPVTLLANPESGVAPLAVSFSILTTLGIPVTSYTLDADGDGTANFTSVALSDSFNYTYAQPGFYVATATLTDDQGNVYTDSVAVNVLSLTELDMLLQSRWKGMKVALISKDINTAIGYLAEGAKSKYQGLFERFGDHLPIIAGNLPALQLVRIDGDVAAYHVTQMENGVEKAHFVYFVRDANGLWRLQAF